MNGIIYRRQYYTAIHYTHLKNISTVIFRIGDFIKLLSFFPLVSHLRVAC